MGYLANRFDGGLVDFLSARDLSPSQFQRLENMRISRVTRLVKRLGETERTAESGTALQVLPGMGHIQYRAERDEDGVQVSSHFRTISLVNVSGTPAMSIRRNNSINDDTGTFTEILGSAAWTIRTVVGSSNISFTANTIIKSSGLDVFFPGDLIRIYGSGNNDVYVNVISATATTITVSETLTVDSNTSAVLVAFPHVSMYAVNGVLRISDGNFHDTAPSQWYGYIKRDFWGQGVTYGSNGGRFSQPPMKEAYTAWYLKAQELVAPTIIAGDRTGQNTSSADEIAIHIGQSLPLNWPDKADGSEWNARDRITCTNVYDFVQESELGKTANGEIGIEVGTPADASKALAVMIEQYTGAANANWNRRRTAIKVYYKFHDDPDWYEIMRLDVNKGWKESEQIFGDENTGYFIPIMDGTIDNTGTTDTPGGSDTTVESDSHGLSTGDIVYFHNTATIEPASIITKPSSYGSVDQMTLPVAMVDSLGVNIAFYSSLDWCAGDESTTAVATFYIPFSGEKAFSYFTNTGRSAKLKVPAFRWRAAATDGVNALVGNIDTLDDNDQTLREASRVIELPAGMPDTALLTRSKDVGIADGDEVMAIVDYQNNWWVMKERNIYVLQKGTLRILGQFKGIGCRWLHSFVITPRGLCVADETGIYLLPSGFDLPLTFPVQATYQGLTFFNPILTYSHKNHLLQFVPDTSSVTSVMLTLDMLHNGWMKDSFPEHTSMSNFVQGRHYEPEVMFEDGDPTLNLCEAGVAGDAGADTDLWTGATGATAPDGWSHVSGSGSYAITDLNGVANFDTTVLVIVAMNMTNRINYFLTSAAGGEGYEDKFGKVFRVTFAYRLDKDSNPSPEWFHFAGQLLDLTDTGLAGDAVLYSEDLIAVDAFSIDALISFTINHSGAILQLDKVVVKQLNSYHVKQLNSGTTDETGLIETADIVLGKEPVTIRNFLLTYKSTDVDVTVKVYLNNNATPANTIVVPASSTLVNKYPILLNTSSEVLSLSFESTATDFTIEDMEIPDSEINPTA